MIAVNTFTTQGVFTTSGQVTIRSRATLNAGTFIQTAARP
jgi:hypothetical protein